MNDNEDIQADIARDDLQFIEGPKRDLGEIGRDIKRCIATGTLTRVDGDLLDVRLQAMEMELDAILAPDRQRIESVLQQAKSTGGL